jgi:hypothetical protein
MHMADLNKDGISAAIKWKELIVEELHKLHTDR